MFVETLETFFGAGLWAVIKAVLILLLAALTVAFAISFGIGGKEFAGRTLEKLEGKFQDVSQKEAPQE